MIEPGPVEIRPVVSKADLDLFHQAGLEANRDHPLWVPPSRHELGRIFSPRSPIMCENAVRAFVALRHGTPLGRIAATVHRARLAKYGEPVGHFGYFETPDDPAVADVLLTAAETWLRGQGMLRVEGPFSLTINHEAGLLVDGFDVPPLVRTSWSPPSYAALLEGRGYRPVMDLLAASCDPAISGYPARVRATLARSLEAGAITTAGLDTLGWRRGSRLVNAFYNEAWGENWGSVAVSDEEADFIAGLSRPVIKGSWIRLAFHGGEPIALVGQIPDANEFAPRDGRLFPFGWARLLGGIHRKGASRSRIALIGVHPRARGTRIGALAISKLLAEALDNARAAGIRSVEISWMLESNRAVLNLCRQMGAKTNRRFRIYTRDLD